MSTASEPSAACSSPDDVARRLIARLDERRGDVMVALGGENLRVQVVVVADGQTHVFRVVFTSGGLVALIRPENLGGEQFAPRFVFAGSGTEIVAILLGTESVTSAIARGVLVPYTDPAPFESFRAFVGAELAELLEEGG